MHQLCWCAKFLEVFEVPEQRKRALQVLFIRLRINTNHYHLLLETTQANISRIMQYLNTSYTTYYNVKRLQSRQ
ncbi:MAG: transposase [Candidatus Omnitrophica bacterium]|nr:transposase [Candidatus Omnitrophota bacterium]